MTIEQGKGRRRLHQLCHVEYSNATFPELDLQDEDQLFENNESVWVIMESHHPEDTQPPTLAILEASEHSVHELAEVTLRMEVMEKVIYKIRRRDKEEDADKTYPLFAWGFQGLMKWIQTGNIYDIGSIQARALVELEWEAHVY